MNPITGVTTAISAVAGAFAAKREAKVKQEEIKSKVVLAKANGEQEVTLKDSEWEHLNVDKSDQTWKDEYVTILCTSPILLILFGAIYGALTEDMRLLDGVTAGIVALQEINVDMGTLTTAVVFAAVGLKLWRQR